MPKCMLYPEITELQPSVHIDFDNRHCLSGPKSIFFLVASQAPSFLFTRTLCPSQYTSPFCPFTILSFFLPPSSLPFSPFFSPSFHFFFLFPFFLPGKFEHFSCLPGSTATMLLRFLSPAAYKKVNSQIT